MYTRRFVVALLSATLLFAQEPTPTVQAMGAVKVPLTIGELDPAFGARSVRMLTKLEIVQVRK